VNVVPLPLTSFCAGSTRENGEKLCASLQERNTGNSEPFLFSFVCLQEREPRGRHCLAHAGRLGVRAIAPLTLTSLLIFVDLAPPPKVNQNQGFVHFLSVTGKNATIQNKYYQSLGASL
jgi:hypothetical protein